MLVGNAEVPDFARWLLKSIAYQLRTALDRGTAAERQEQHPTRIGAFAEWEEIFGCYYGTLRSEIDALKARQRAVEDLQTDRNVPVYLLDEIVKQTPEGVYLTSIRQNLDSVTITGLSLTNERVSELLRNTAYNSTWLERPELIEIKSVNVPVGRDQRRMFDFNLRVTIKRPQAPQRAGAASAPVKAKG